MAKKKTVAAAEVSPALKFTHTRLLVDDVDACYKFYRDTLGFKPKFDAEGSVYAEFDLAGHLLALFSRRLMMAVVAPNVSCDRTQAPDTAVLALEVADVDATAATLQKRGVALVTEPHDQRDWLLRVAHFRDPDGNLIEINAPLPPAEETAAPAAAGQAARP
jgi:catechol 2,3-dioxygenase-like lactoylglutathione lyase family enzyme